MRARADLSSACGRFRNAAKAIEPALVAGFFVLKGKKVMRFTSKLVHSDRHFGVQHGALIKPIHPGVTYGYEDTHDLAAVFQGKQAGYTYGRQISPTIEALQRKVTEMEEGLATVCFGTGMAAIGTALFALLKAGDHVVTSQYLFGNTASLFQTFVRQGIDVTFVDSTSVSDVEQAMTDKTRVVFTETIANPRTQVADLYGIGALCKDRQVLYIVDNTVTTPYLFSPKAAGADMVVNSLTKYIGGHGNALGGAITDLGTFDWSAFDNILEIYRSGNPGMWGINQIKKKGLRDFGASMSPDAAHRVSAGSDTLALRMARCCDTALALAHVLNEHDLVEQVYYPGLPNHPQHERSANWFKHHGAILSFEPRSDLDCFELLNAMRLVVKATHLGDLRTLALPVAQTIFYELGPERRAQMGIEENLIRMSIGIEDAEDLIEDVQQALAHVARML